jgi:perosamine synthetase
MALQLIGVQPDDEVLVSDLSFVAPANAVRYCGAHPVFIDADPVTWQMDLDKAERFLRQTCVVRRGVCYNTRTRRRVRAMLPVHILGLACAMDRVMELARAYDLRVVEDAAEALGVRYQGRHVGTFGDVGIFSFNGNKIITSGGGGMLVTDDPRVAARARYLTTQAKDDGVEYIHRELGYNYRLTNLQAAVGVAQLERLEGFIAKKRAIAQRYAQWLQQERLKVSLMPAPVDVEPTYWLYSILLEQGTTVAKRQGIIRRLHASGIEARPLWPPLHRLPLYRRCQAVESQCATQLYARAVSLPSSVGLHDDDLARCVETLKQVIAER